MAGRLTDTEVRQVSAPTGSNRIIYDAEVKGFGVRVTSAGAKAFVLNYRVAGRERRLTIGSFPDWNVKAAREHARSLKRQIDMGVDPLAERDEERAAQTVDQLCTVFERDHLPMLRETTQQDYRSLLRLYIRPRLGKLKISAVRPSDISALHRQIAGRAPYRANRMLAVLSKMMGLAVTEGWREDNPCSGVGKAREDKRERFLDPAEMARLGKALKAHPEKTSANAIRLLALTGARRGEVLKSTWDQFDLIRGVWTKPTAHTKQKKNHRVPLNAAALELLISMKRSADEGCPYVFPSSKTSRPVLQGTCPKYVPLTDIKHTWSSVCKAAGIKGARLHDLRHTFASVLASNRQSLPIIGALLGHTQASTTLRYAHLLDDPLRAATEHVGLVISGAEVSAPPLEPLNRA